MHAIEPTYTLVSKDIGSKFSLLALNDFDVSFHAFLRKCLCEEVGDVGVGVQTTELFQKTRSGCHFVDL
jgi:hypothetical protein